MSFKEYNQDQLFLLPPSLHNFLPDGHLARVINEVVREFELRALYDHYSDLGSSAYHPQIMVKVLFYGYAMGEWSSRVIAHGLKSDVAYMYLSALQQPDFKTINRFRKDNIDVLRGLFVQMVRICVGLGMVSIGTTAIDGAKLKANASYRKTMKKADLDEKMKEIESILGKCEEIDRREDEAMGEDESVYEIRPELRDKQTLRERVNRANEKLLVQGLRQINLTDEEATTILHKGYRAERSYNGQIAVEESNGVIMAATPSNNLADYEALVELVEQTELLGDYGFLSFENL